MLQSNVKLPLRHSGLLAGGLRGPLRRRYLPILEAESPDRQYQTEKSNGEDAETAYTLSFSKQIDICEVQNPESAGNDEDAYT